LCVRSFFEDNWTGTYQWEVGNVWNDDVSDMRRSVGENRTRYLGHKKRRSFWISGIDHRINGINVLGIEVSPKEDMSMWKTSF
jgi:hypothetical protein